MNFNRFVAAFAAVLIILGSAVCAYGAEKLPAEVDSVRVCEKMTEESVNTCIGKLDYRIYRSPSFDPVDSENPAVLIIYLHNDSGKGADNTAQLSERGFLNQLVSDDADRLFSEHPYVIVAPQCPVGRSFADAEMVEAVEQLREEIVYTKGAFTGKSIILGIGNGADGVFEYIATYPACIERAVTVGGSPNKERVVGALACGVSLLAFAQEGDEHFGEFCDYAKRMGEDAYLTAVLSSGNLAACVDAALKYNEPSVAKWCISDYMTNRNFNISATCDDGGKISVSPTPVKYGGNATVMLTLNKGYVISRLVVDGNDVSVALFEQSESNKNQYVYTFVGVTENHSVRVELLPVAEEGDMTGFIKTLMIALSITSAVLIVGAVTVFAVSTFRKKD